VRIFPKQRVPWLGQERRPTLLLQRTPDASFQDFGVYGMGYLALKRQALCLYPFGEDKTFLPKRCV
jgi:hypothetical protein